MKPCDKPNTLLAATIDMIRKDKRTRLDQALELTVPYHWLSQLMAGNIKSPSVNRIQHIYEQLSGKKLV